jgi:hypothetical protein
MKAEARRPIRSNRIMTARRESTTLIVTPRIGPKIGGLLRVADRRRSRRFGVETLPGTVIMAGSGCADERGSGCTLVNISCGGMCFRAPHPLEIGTAARYRIFLDPLPRAVLVTAEVRWVGADAITGAEFTESSDGWFGPDE